MYKKNQCINCKNFKKCCNENEVDSVDIFASQDKCEDFIDGRLSIKELREQFELRYVNIDKSKRGSTKLYSDLTTQLKFDSWVECADTYNLLKGGE